MVRAERLVRNAADNREHAQRSSDVGPEAKTPL
jgi:hypothetical protein